MTTTTTKWTPSVQDANELWTDGLAIASEIVNHGVHFCSFEIVRGKATGFSLPEIRTKTRAGADAIYLAIAADGYWHITDAVGDEVGNFPRGTHPRAIAVALMRAHNDFTS